MSVDDTNYRRALEDAERLSTEQQHKLIEELTRKLEDSIAPLALSGTWHGVSLSAQEIDEARRECWFGPREGE